MERINAEKPNAQLALEMRQSEQALAANSYPGRGIVLGADAAGTKLVQVYWIMGRSVNSRNRVFRQLPGGIVRTEAFDPKLLSDPSLVIYNAAHPAGKAWIVTNGDQTDTIAKALVSGGGFESALETREYEPDAPNFTSRISGIMDLSDPAYAFRLSILRHGAGGCDRFTWRFARAQAGVGRFISTYSGDGDPLPAFSGEPIALPMPSGGAREIAEAFWKLLDAQNRISVMARTIDPETGEAETFIVNGKESG
jgi:IMP cyclohydrolase